MIVNSSQTASVWDGNMVDVSWLTFYLTLGAIIIGAAMAFAGLRATCRAKLQAMQRELDKIWDAINARDHVD